MTSRDQLPTTSWFYRVGSREVGPVMSSRLRQLARQGRLAEDDLVRMGRTGEWVEAGTIEWLAARPRAQPRTPLPRKEKTPEEPPRPGALAEVTESAAYAVRNLYYTVTHALLSSLWLMRHGAGVVALIVIVIVLVRMADEAGLLDWSPPVDALSAIQSLGDEVKQKREAGATDAEWDELTERGTRTLQPVVARLQREASSTNRIAQMLLWAARDCLPKMFHDARTEPSDAERRFDEYMQNVALLQRNEPIYGGNLGGRIARGSAQSLTGSGPTTNLLVLGMIVVDAALVVGGIWWWRRRRA